MLSHRELCFHHLVKLFNFFRNKIRAVRTAERPDIQHFVNLVHSRCSEQVSEPFQSRFSVSGRNSSYYLVVVSIDNCKILHIFLLLQHGVMQALSSLHESRQEDVIHNRHLLVFLLDVSDSLID